MRRQPYLDAPMSSVAAAILVSFLTCPTYARLGETPDQCNQRYGTNYTETVNKAFYPLERVYSTRGLQVTVRFLPPRKGVALPKGTLLAGFIRFDVPGILLPPDTVKGLLATETGAWDELSMPSLMPAPPPPTVSRVRGGLGPAVTRMKTIPLEGDQDDPSKRYKEWSAQRDRLGSAAGIQGIRFWSTSLRLGTVTYYAVEGMHTVTLMTGDYVAISGASSEQTKQKQAPPGNPFQGL